MSELLETLGTDGWPGGVIAATDASLLGPAAAAAGHNSALALSSTGVPYAQKRMGLRVVNSTPLTSVPAIIGQFNYFRIANTTSYHVLASDDGRLTYMDSDGTVHTINNTLTAGDHYPDFAVANDLLFIVNGSDKIKWDAATLTAFGITRPTVGSMAGAAGAAGSPSGTYALRVTYANSSTGAESSASDTATSTVTVTNQKIDVTAVPVSADAQVDTRYIYVRNTATQTQFYRAGTIANNSGTTITLDFVDANLTIVAPTTDSNNPPPSGIKYLAFHQERMWAFTDTAGYYSQIGKPEAFPAANVEYFGKSSGQRITGAVSDHEILVVFKEDQVYGVFNGNDPAAWQVRLVSSDFGCASHRTIRTTQKWTLWWSRHGIIRWDGGADVDDIGMKLYGNPSDRVDYSNIIRASACYDEGNARYIVAVPSSGSSRADLLLPFNVQLGIFESDQWDPMDAASLGEFVDSDNVPQPFLGGYKGQLFQMWQTNNDGIEPLTTAKGTWVQSGTTATTITDALATFSTTGGGLVERKVTILNDEGTIITPVRPRISSNTGTTFTLSTGLTGLTSGVTYTYIIGGPNFLWQTGWRTFNIPWTKKRYEFVYLNFKGPGLGFGSAATVNVGFDWLPETIDTKQIPFNSSTSQGLWDDPTSLWDISIWDSGGSSRERHRLAQVGWAHQIRVRCPDANQPFAILYLGADSVSETRKN